MITLVCGFILPRLIISHYGSYTNGLLSSITQFLAFFSMMEMGVGAVTRASLYDPLARNDKALLSQVLISSKRFFDRMGLLLCAYSLVLMILFPLLVDRSMGALPTAVLVIAVAFSSVCQYLFGVVYMQLLNADQKTYILNITTSITLILNTIFSVVLINLNTTIQTVKIAAALVLLLKPIALKIYVEKHYDINWKQELDGEPLKQKWNGLAQHVANYIHKHADTVILTFFSTLKNVSIYYVYHLVTAGLQQVVEILTTGISSLLGDMYARKENDKLNSVFSAFEWAVHTIVTLIYSIAGILIIPFVRVYTRGVTDANYIVPLFAFFIVVANGIYCIRLPYNHMALSAGRFKETQNSAIVEATINVLVSIILVFKFGLVGVAIGTFVSMLYRTIYLAWFLKNHILFRPFKYFVSQVLVDIVTIAIAVVSTRWITLGNETYLSWLLMALKIGVLVSLESIAVNFLFYKKEIMGYTRLFLNRRDNVHPNA